MPNVYFQQSLSKSEISKVRGESFVDGVILSNIGLSLEELRAHIRYLHKREKAAVYLPYTFMSELDGISIKGYGTDVIGETWESILSAAPRRDTYAAVRDWVDRQAALGLGKVTVPTKVIGSASEFEERFHILEEASDYCTKRDLDCIPTLVLSDSVLIDPESVIRIANLTFSYLSCSECFIVPIYSRQLAGTLVSSDVANGLLIMRALASKKSKECAVLNSGINNVLFAMMEPSTIVCAQGKKYTNFTPDRWTKKEFSKPKTENTEIRIKQHRNLYIPSFMTTVTEADYDRLVEAGAQAILDEVIVHTGPSKNKDGNPIIVKKAYSEALGIMNHCKSLPVTDIETVKENINKARGQLYGFIQSKVVEETGSRGRNHLAWVEALDKYSNSRNEFGL